MNLQSVVRSILIRELRALRRELDSYQDENQIWEVPSGISNSAGTLALHLLGNLQTFVGSTLGDSGYVRDREAEFSRRDVPRSELNQEIERTIQAIDSTLQNLQSDQIHTPFPIVFGDQSVEAGDFLVHLVSHLAFHLGQVDYHRRLVTGENRSIGPIAIPELATISTNR